MSENNRNGGAPMPPPPVKSNDEDAAGEIFVTDGVKPAGVGTANQMDTSGDKPVAVQLGDQAPDSSVVVKPAKSGIMVTAILKGFYGGLRRNVGDKFMIKTVGSWGTWMECNDKKVQSELMLSHKNKMKKIREKSFKA